MSASNLIRRHASRSVALRKSFDAHADAVQKAGRRPFSAVARFPDGARLREAERAMGEVGARLTDADRRVVAAIRRLARERGIDPTPEVPLAVEAEGFLWVVHLDGRDVVSLVAVPLARVARLD